MTCVIGAGAAAAEAGVKVRADFNGDGFEDLAIGSPGEEIGGDAQSGQVNVTYGTKFGLKPLNNPPRIQTFFQDQPGIVREFSEPGDNFGFALATGDFNGDGFDDLAVGVPFEDLIKGGVNLANAGCVHVLYGSTFGLQDGNDQVWDQDSPGMVGVPAQGVFFGQTLAAGDFNKDGFDELAIGATGQSVNGVNDVGAVFTIRGSSLGLTGTGSQFLTEPAIFGIPTFGQRGDGFGTALAVGDWGGDGFADLAIGVPGRDFGGGVSSDPTDRGSVIIVLGSTIGLKFDLRGSFNQDQTGMLDDAEPFDRFGSSLAAGDFNGDGRDDLAIGIPFEDILTAAGNIHNTGAVAVVYGTNIGGGPTTTGNQLWHQDISGIEDANETNDNFGRALATGDFNGDGRDDLAIGVPLEDLGGAPNSGVQDAGAVEVIYGGANGLTAVNDQRWSQASADFFTNQFIIDEPEFGDFFGSSVGAGDFNGDGRDDLVVGVPSEDELNIDNGAVHIIYGAASGLVMLDNQFIEQHMLFELLEPSDRFGTTVARREPFVSNTAARPAIQ